MTAIEDPMDAATLENKLSKLKIGPLENVEADGASPEDSPLALDENIREWLDKTIDSVSAGPVANPRVYTKLLVSNAAAGSIIGKAGSNINSFQTQTYARMQLSKPEEYFPGTTERTLLITGRIKQVVAALGLVLNKLIRENVAPISPRYKASLQDPEALETPDADGTRLMIKLLVPQSLCGIVIGKGGANIKYCSNQTGTSIRLLSPEGPRLPLTHKIFLMSGTSESVQKAVALLILKQSQDIKYQSFSELQPSYLLNPNADLPGMGLYPGAAYPGMQGMYYAPHVQQGPGSRAHTIPVYGVSEDATNGGVDAQPAGDMAYYTLPVILTDLQVGLLGSRGGAATIQQVEHITGTRMQLHQEARRLDIAGLAEGVQMAHYMLNQRLTMMAMQYNGYSVQYNGYPVQYTAVAAASGNGHEAAGSINGRKGHKIPVYADSSVAAKINKSHAGWDSSNESE